MWAAFRCQLWGKLMLILHGNAFSSSGASKPDELSEETIRQRALVRSLFAEKVKADNERVKGEASAERSSNGRT